jgi:hypothetical protein
MQCLGSVVLVWIHLTGTGQGHGSKQTFVVTILDRDYRSFIGDLLCEGGHLSPAAPSRVLDGTHVDPAGGIERHVLVAVEDAG